MPATTNAAVRSGTSAAPVAQRAGIADGLELERAGVMPMPSTAGGYVEHTVKVSRTCLIGVGRNRYSLLRV
jgi:hypothetical protein